MALSKAIEFVKQVSSDKEFRTQCNKNNSKIELLQHLNFNEIEFEDALNMQLVKCQTYEEAEVFQQLKIWFLLL